jgi:hypothetical protein
MDVWLYEVVAAFFLPLVDHWLLVGHGHWLLVAAGGCWLLSAASLSPSLISSPLVDIFVNH